jgi:hypothetical protein
MISQTDLTPGEREFESFKEYWRSEGATTLPETERVKGIKRPREAGKAVPTARIRRLDLNDLRTRANETFGQALQRVRTVIGRRISETPLREAWETARSKVLAGREIKTITREEMIRKGGIYDQVRDTFWDEVKTSSAARQYLSDAGFAFGGGRAPLLEVSATDIGEQELRISLDHIEEKAIGENYGLAIDADNLRMEFQNPNSFREAVQKKFPELRKNQSGD